MGTLITHGIPKKDLPSLLQTSFLDRRFLTHQRCMGSSISESMIETREGIESLAERTMRKVRWRILPLVFLLYMIALLDRPTSLTQSSR